MTKNQSKENKNPEVNPLESAQRIDAIKNLIFGENYFRKINFSRTYG